MEWISACPAALPVHRLCALLGLGRSTFYKSRVDATSREDERLRLVDAIDAIVLEYKRYGYRRVTAQLRRDGWHINGKRVLLLMREESLLCRLRRRWTPTTDSSHGLQVWPNLLKETRTTDLNQAWVADITYIRLPEGFCYLAAVLDAHSRKVVGWDLSNEIDGRLTLHALEMALKERNPPKGFIHHSDRGVQYACRSYVDRLQAAGARISMASRGAPRENAKAESFFRTLKMEEVYLQEGQGYATIGDARRSIRRFIHEVYNQKRLHSSLGYLPPAEYEIQFTK